MRIEYYFLKFNFISFYQYCNHFRKYQTIQRLAATRAETTADPTLKKVEAPLNKLVTFYESLPSSLT